MNEAIDIQIERYITKKMMVDEAQEFEKQLASDESLRENYKATLAAYELATEAGRLDLKDTLESFESENELLSEEEKSRPIHLWIKFVLPIAAILIVYVAVYQFGLFSESLSPSELYKNNFEVYASPSNLRDITDTPQLDWEEAMALYEAQNYEEALFRLENLETDVPRYIISFYSGISAMAKTKPNYELAIRYFDLVLKTDTDYSQQSHWYKALALLKMNKTEEASAVFQDIVASKSFNYKNSERILKEISKD